MPSEKTTARIAAFTNRTARQRSASLWSRLHAWAYRRTGGRFVGTWFGAPIVVLQTVGRRTGQPRETTVIALPEGDDLVVLAANAGNDRPPAWWLNLEAAGQGTVIASGVSRTVRPRVAEGEERARLWQRIVRAYPPAAHYPSFTDRPLPVVVLEKA